MQVPAVGFIEIAADELTSLPPSFRKSQVAELRSLGDPILNKLGVSQMTEEFERGYELGLQTGRVLLEEKNFRPGGPQS